MAAPLTPNAVTVSLQVDTKQGADPKWLQQMAEKYNKISGPFQGSGQKLGGGHDSCLCLGDRHKGTCQTSEESWQMPLKVCIDTRNAEQCMVLESVDGRSHCLSALPQQIEACCFA